METSRTEELTNDEILRYSRQLILPEFGVSGQKQLKSASALIVGCGGLGCPSAIFLAAAGVGTLGLLDHDEVEVSNLHRQILHKEMSAGVPKCDSAKEACAALNSLTNLRVHHMAIDSSNALDVMKDYDVILDCTDNVSTRYLLNDASILLNKPLVSGAALKFEGQLTVYNYKGGPCYRCLYPTPPPAHTVTSCSEGGVMGVIPGIIGTMQAQEAIKVLASMQGVLSGRLFLYDGLTFATRIFKLRPKQAACAVCGDNPTVTQLIDYVQFCGTQAADDKPIISDEARGKTRISVHEYKEKYLDVQVDHILIDTRPSHELDICSFTHSTNVPLRQLTELSTPDLTQLLNIPTTSDEHQPTPIICICHHGNDSQVAVKHIIKTLNLGSRFPEVVDVIGGLDSWARNVDKNFPRY